MASYKAFYQLTEDPFTITPDPRFLFESKQHHDALQAVSYGLETQKGIIAIIGDVGTGKTTLCRALLKMLPAQYKTALLLNPHVSEEDLVRAIVEDLGIQPESLEMSSLMRVLETFLLQTGERGECVVVMVDEAQHLSPSVLERLRILSNFETSTHKLLQIILVGQNELEEKLQLYDLLPLDQRIGVRAYLRPLSRGDTWSYIEHRLRRAGLDGRIPFTRAALHRIRRFSQGTPRLINLVCDRSLFTGYLARTREIDSSLVAIAVQGLAQRRRKSLTPKLATATVGGLALAVLVGMAAWRTMGWEPSRALPIAEIQSILRPPLSAERQATAMEIVPPVTQDPFQAAPQLVVPVSTAPLQTLQKPLVQPETNKIPHTVKSPMEGVRYQLSRLLALWGVEVQSPDEIANWPVTPDGSPDVRVIAARHGLEAVLFEALPWQGIYTIGLPVLLKIGEEKAFSLLLRLEGGKALILSPKGMEDERSIGALENQKFRSGWFLWRNPERWVLLPPREWTERMIALVGARLNAMGYLSHPFPLTYDERFGEAVRRFQQKVGLKADGIMGLHTALALARLTDDPKVPTLQGAHAQ